MEDNIDCSPDTTAFSDGYKAGWKARGEYIRDYNASIVGTSFGLSLMMLGAFVFTIFVATAIFMPVIVERVAIALLCAAAVIAMGYCVNKLENKSLLRSKPTSKKSGEKFNVLQYY